MTKRFSFSKLALTLSIAAMTTFGSVSSYAADKNVVLAVASTFTTLDPYDSQDTLSQAVSKSFYQGLFGFDKDMKLQHILADSYTITDDGLEYVFKLRAGVKFHDDTDFNADAVKANFERVINPDNHLKRYNMFNRIKTIEVIDEHTVKMTLAAPFSAFINVLAHPSAVMISPKALETYGNKIGFNPVGTGPFKFVEWNPTDSLKVTKFDDYWKEGYPKVDNLTWKPVLDNNTRAAVIQTGEAMFAEPIPYEQTKILQKNNKLEVVSVPSIIMRYVSINVREKPFDDIRVRQAMNYAVNRAALAKVVFAGHATPAKGIVPMGVDYAVEYEPWPYDIAKAKALLDEAGYPDGFKTTLWSAYNNTTAQKAIQFVQQQLAQINIKAEIQALETGQRVAQVESIQNPDDAKVRLYYIGWSSSTGESDWALTPLLATKSWPPQLANSAYYSNERVDECLELALQTTDRNEKEALYKEAQDLIWTDVPWISLVTEDKLYVINKNLSGIYVIPDGSYNFDEIDLKQ